MTASLSPLRTGRITGSRIAAVLGESPWATPDDVLRAMVREAFGAEAEFTGNAATDHGHEHEPRAIFQYAEKTDVVVHGQQEIVLHPDYPDLLAVTPDGLVGDDGMIEAKCPYRAAYVEMPAHYVPQVQLQLACTGREWCDFLIYRPGFDLIVQRVLPDPWWLPEVLTIVEDFLDIYRAIIADPALAAPFLEPLVASRQDGPWLLAAEEFRSAKISADAAKARHEAARGALIDLAAGKASEGGGVLLSAVRRSPSVNYREALEKYAPDADLSAFSKDSSLSWQVRLAGEK